MLLNFSINILCQSCRNERNCCVSSFLRVIKCKFDRKFVEFEKLVKMKILCGKIMEDQESNQDTIIKIENQQERLIFGCAGVVC